MRLRGTAFGGWVAAVATGSACVAVVPVPESADVVAARAAYPSAGAADLAAGRDVFIDRCGGCHTLPPPRSVPPSDWPGEIEAMRGERGVALSDVEVEQLSAYLYAISSRTERAPAR